MLKKEDRYCIDCGKKGVVERRRCDSCAKEHNRQRAIKHSKQFGRYNYGKSICPICGEEMTLWRKDQASHSSCRPKTVEDYNKLKRSPIGNIVAKEVMISNGVEIPNGFVVHHLDENPDNNSIFNLIVISRSAHNSLHRKLQYHRSLFLKESSSNSEDCWKPLRDHLTKAWLETTGAKVIKINDIGQSAAEPPSSKESEEGSEAMHGTPKSQDMVKIWSGQQTYSSKCFRNNEL